MYMITLKFYSVFSLLSVSWWFYSCSNDLELDTQESLYNSYTEAKCKWQKLRDMIKEESAFTTQVI